MKPGVLVTCLGVQGDKGRVGAPVTSTVLSAHGPLFGSKGPARSK